MKISEIIYKEEYIMSLADEELEFSRIVTNPKNVDKGSLLIIPNSERTENNIELPEKPVAIICDTKCVLPENIPVIRVSNPRLAMANAYFRYEKNIHGQSENNRHNRYKWQIKHRDIY